MELIEQAAQVQGFVDEVGYFVLEVGNKYPNFINEKLWLLDSLILRAKTLSQRLRKLEAKCPA
jgi:hypothetical protein